MEVYQAFADSSIDGLALYGAVPPGGTELDLVSWIVGHVRTNIEVKGGPHKYVNGVWRRSQDGIDDPISCPAAQAFDAGMKLHRHLKAHQGEHSPYVVSVLVLPDMPAGHVLEQVNSQTIIICGLEDLVERVKAQAVERHTIHFPPTWVDARRESQLLLAGQPEPEPPASTGGAALNGVGGLLRDGGVYIERVENLHLHLDGKAAADIPA